LVSIIVPSYNHAIYLPGTLDSVLAQTYSNWECIIVNDGSSDNTEEIAKQYCRKDVRIKYVYQNNSGPAVARNTGIKKSAGDFILPLDSDDLISKDYLTEAVNIYKANPATKLVYCKAELFGDAAGLWELSKYSFDELLFGNMIFCTAMYKKSDYAKTIGYNPNMTEGHEDWDFWLTLLKKDDLVYQIPKVHFYYRIRNNSRTKIGNRNKELTEKIYWKIFSNHRDLYEGEINPLYTAYMLHLKNEECQQRDQEILHFKQTVAKRDEQIAALYHSTSWRITLPLRIFAYQAKRVLRVAAQVLPAIRHNGGFKGTFKKAMQLYRREGLAGIKRGFIKIATFRYDRNNYAEWVRRYDTLNNESHAIIRSRIDNFVRKPLISVVMPTYNSKQEWLIEAIESIRKQIYPYWELCIADDASTDKKIRLILENYAGKDKRIKVVFREKNGHISAASNSALALATGEWVGLLDHDDLLAEHALFWVADAINQNPTVCLIYSDEDKINSSGERFDPYFKCDWNADLFYSHNLISHLGVYYADLLKKIGGFREGMDGSQDYDLALRCVEQIEPQQIHHIPHVLYHWRTHGKSTAKSADAKPYAMLAGERALNEHFQRQRIKAGAELIGYGYRVRYALPDKLPLVSLIILTRNGLQLLQCCVKSILKKTTYPNYEILIIDNGSDDTATLQYFKQLQTDPQIRVVRDNRPFNYSALNNAAVKLTRGEIVALLNNDLEIISAEWLSEMVSHALRPGVGAVGARLWYPDDTLQHGGIVLGLGGVAGHAHDKMPRHHYGYFGRAALISSFSAVSAACLVIRKTVYDEVGGLNENDLQVAYNDVDFCLRVCKAGYRNIWTPYAELYHHESATRGRDYSAAKMMRYVREIQYMKQRWGDTLLNDPAYSPNLTLGYGDFSLAWPPRVNFKNFL
jgi:glycosyltransferase involved in cell wall biosynthesis